jgi:hypothetical protein
MHWQRQERKKDYGWTDRMSIGNLKTMVTVKKQYTHINLAYTYIHAILIIRIIIRLCSSS